MKRPLLIAMSLFACAGCGPPASSTPQPTAIATATPPEEPTDTAEPTDVATPTLTPTDVVEPTETGVPTRAPRPLNVTFTDLHYECRKTCTQQGRPPHENRWSYRYLQVLMVVENRSPVLTVPENWEPSRWIVTDGERDWDETYFGRWAYEGHDAPIPPALEPGARVEWTFNAIHLSSGAWVRAVEYVDPWGNLYRQELPKPSEGQFNWSDCGEPRDGSC